MVRTSVEGNSNNIWRNRRRDNGMKNNETAGTDSLQAESFKYGRDKTKKKKEKMTAIVTKGGEGKKGHQMEERDFLSIV